MKRFGLILLIVGGLVLVTAFAMDTSVDTGAGGRVHNIGLMNEKQNTLLLGAALAIVGSVLFGFSYRPSSADLSASAASASEKKCPFCAEKIKSEAVVCRFCSRDLASTQTNDVPIELPATHDELMALYGISHDGEMYQYEQYRYQKLDDAVAYAQMQREKA